MTVSTSLVGPPIAVTVPAGMPSTVIDCPTANPNSAHERKSARVMVWPAKTKLLVVLVAGSNTEIVPVTPAPMLGGAPTTVRVLPETPVIIPNGTPFHSSSCPVANS